MPCEVFKGRRYNRETLGESRRSGSAMRSTSTPRIRSPWSRSRATPPAPTIGEHPDSSGPAPPPLVGGKLRVYRSHDTSARELSPVRCTMDP